MVDDEVDGAGRVDSVGVSAESLEGVTHTGEVDDAGNSGEVLEEHSGGLEGNVDVLAHGLFPIENLLDISALDVELVAVSDGALEKDSDTEGESLDSGVVESLDGVVLVGLVTDLELLEGVGVGVLSLHLFY